MRSRALFVVCLGVCALAPMAFAQPADALKKAQSAFDQAQLDYLQGKYDEAAQEFQDAYAARNFPQFLYNVGASFHMKGKKDSNVDAYKKAVDFYKRYLTEDPQAADKPKVEKAITVLEAEIKRLNDPATKPPEQGATPTPPVVSNEVKELGDVKVRGLIVVESEPQNATIYLDDKKKGPFATTPWSGSIDGEHKIIIEKRGYMVSESTIAADPSKLFVLRAVMSQENFLGWVDITSNVPGADIFIDDKSVGAVGKTPLSQNMKPGKHTFWISSDGYDEYKEDLEIIAGQAHAVKGTLKGSPVGKLNILGLGIEDSTIIVDGKVLCERGPCLKGVQQGDHTVSVTRPGFKPYSRRVNIQAKTETSIKIGLSPEPSRSDAVIAYILTGAFTGGGIFLGLQANKIHNDLQSGINNGSPPVDNNDPRFTKGKVFAIAADASFLLAAITGGTALYYTFRDKGAPSTGLIDVRALALKPEVNSQFAGLGLEVTW